MKYNIEKLSRNFFPWFWQNDTNLAFIDVLMGSLAATNTNLFNFENESHEIAGYSIQRLSLEISLNNQFDNSDRRIRVENGDIGGNEFIFNEVETPDAALIIYIFNESETPTSPAEDAVFYNSTETATTANTGFTVFIPAELLSLQNEIEAWVNRVLVFGTEYQVILT